MAKVDMRDVASSTMTLQAHIREARDRLFIVALAFLVFSSLAYVFRDEIIHILLQPLAGQKLSYLTPGGGFSFIFKVSMWTGIAASFPVAIYSLYKFITPTLPQRVRRYSAVLLLASSLLLVAGVSFGYVFAIPGAINFLLTFADTYVSAMLTADSYLSFILAYTLGLGIIFQIPLILLIIHWIKPLKPMKLLGFERYVIVIAFVVAAILTPTPDPTNQAIIAAPMIALYQVGIATVSLSVWRERRTERKQQRTAANAVAKSQPFTARIPTVTPQIQQPTPIVSRPVAHTREQQPVSQMRRGRSIDGVRTQRSLAINTSASRANINTTPQRPTLVLNTLAHSKNPVSRQHAQRLSVDGIRRSSTA